MYGRNGESPVIVIAASTPSNSFDFAYEACKLALEHMTPVILLTDGYIANGSAPWKIKKAADMPPIGNQVVKEGTNHVPYKRDEKSLARNWAIPGTPNLEHRVGGLEKDKTTGNVSQEPLNHQFQTEIRAEKVRRVQDYIPEIHPEYQEAGDLLVVGWGGTYGSLNAAVNQMNQEGYKVGHLHFNYINPLPKNTLDQLKKFKKVIVCELNAGQMVQVLKNNYQEIDYLQYNKAQGLPFTTLELTEKFKQVL